MTSSTIPLCMVQVMMLQGSTMLSSIMFALLSVLGMMASASLLWLGYEVSIGEWKDGREIVLVIFCLFMAGLATWGSYTAGKNSVFEFRVRNY